MSEDGDILFKLIDKLDFIVEEHDYDYNKIEIIIKNNELYNSLTLDDQIVILEICMEKIEEKNKNPDINNKKIKKEKIKKEKIISNETKNNKCNTKNEELKPSVKDIQISLKKKHYTFGKEPEKIIMIKDKSGNMVSEGEALSSRTVAVIVEEINDAIYDRRAGIFNKVKAIPLPAQRSKEWFEMRNEKITGSDAGCVLNMNKHEPQFNFVLKKVFGSTFEGNYACYHGKVFEEVVTMMYELENNVKTEEFGLLAHEKIDMLAASPDGICSQYCLDGKTKSPLVGRMLEIKCPTMRKIKYKGNIIDNICPVYYYCQIQQQMESVDLDECDFIQCNIERYGSRKEWLEDTNENCDYKSKKHDLYRGVVIELLPKKLEIEDYTNNKINDLTIWNKATFLYPPRIDMTNKEIDEWILETLDNLKEDVILHKIIYWKLLEKNCTLIKRDKEWFQKQMPIYQKIWDYVLYLRLNLNVGNEWKEWIESLPRKYNDKIFMKLDELIKINNNKYITNINKDKDYYKILDLKKNASESEIKSAYFKLGKFWTSNEDLKKKELKKKLEEILEAQSILLDNLSNNNN